jgi:hypothetical protein
MPRSSSAAIISSCRNSARHPSPDDTRDGEQTQAGQDGAPLPHSGRKAAAAPSPGACLAASTPWQGSAAAHLVQLPAVVGVVASEHISRTGSAAAAGQADLRELGVAALHGRSCVSHAPNPACHAVLSMHVMLCWPSQSCMPGLTAARDAERRRGALPGLLALDPGDRGLLTALRIWERPCWHRQGRQGSRSVKSRSAAAACGACRALLQESGPLGESLVWRATAPGSPLLLPVFRSDEASPLTCGVAAIRPTVLLLRAAPMNDSTCSGTGPPIIRCIRLVLPDSACATCRGGHAGLVWAAGRAPQACHRSGGMQDGLPGWSAVGAVAQRCKARHQLCRQTQM